MITAQTWDKLSQIFSLNKSTGFQLKNSIINITQEKTRIQAYHKIFFSLKDC